MMKIQKKKEIEREREGEKVTEDGLGGGGSIFSCIPYHCKETT